MEVKIPSQGVGMTEAVIAKWLKQPGDQVAEGEIIAEMETDKTVVELLAPGAGTLGPHLAAEGDVVEVGKTIVVIEAAS
jgi:pyruvate/2-oxoglutarate dehydrogenase complex dihydrolipoamide acyltransferase (E2) component